MEELARADEARSHLRAGSTEQVMSSELLEK